MNGGESANVRMVRAAVEAFNRGDFESALANARDEITWAPFLARTETPLLRGRDEVLAAFKRQFEVLDLDIRAEILGEAHRDGEDVVVADVTMSARGHGSDVPLEARFWQLYTLRDGKVASVDSYDTADEALQAAGISR